MEIASSVLSFAVYRYTNTQQAITSGHDSLKQTLNDQPWRRFSTGDLAAELKKSTTLQSNASESFDVASGSANS